MWGTFLSEPLLIVGMVGRYPAIYLIRRIPIPYRNPLFLIECSQRNASGINPAFAGLFPGRGQVGYALLTRAPVAIRLSKLNP